MATCYIVGAGDFDGAALEKREGDFVIAADGGYLHLRKIGVAPDLLMGDFDSIGEVPDEVPIQRFPPEKDDTDMMIAIKAALSMGYGRIVLLGALGGRFDHTFANIQALLFIARHGARGMIAGNGAAMTVVENGEVRFDASHKGYVSVFALGGVAEGVDLHGLKYPLENAALTPDVPLGCSNEFLGTTSSVAVRRGALLVAWQGGIDQCHADPPCRHTNDLQKINT